MKILYLPILEMGTFHANAVAYKRGLYTALAVAGHQVTEYDYLDRSRDQIAPEMAWLITVQQPDLLISQLHGADILSPDEIRQLRALYPAMKWVNWSADSWAHSLTAQPILDMARELDLQLVAAPDVLPVYEAQGIPARYWNIAYEPPVVPLPDMPTYDVVWLANVLNEKRRALMEHLKELPNLRVGIYGDWEHADGNNVYDFAAGEALYRNATLAIADNVYPDQQNYISNRPMQCMAAGGALLLHQHVPKMRELSGWEVGKQYLEWQMTADLDALITEWLPPEQAPARKKMVLAAQQQVLKYHTFAVRVGQLMEWIARKE